MGQTLQSMPVYTVKPIVLVVYSPIARFRLLKSPTFLLFPLVNRHSWRITSAPFHRNHEECERECHFGGKRHDLDNRSGKHPCSAREAANQGTTRSRLTRSIRPARFQGNLQNRISFPLLRSLSRDVVQLIRCSSRLRIDYGNCHRPQRRFRFQQHRFCNEYCDRGCAQHSVRQRGCLQSAFFATRALSHVGDSAGFWDRDLRCHGGS